VSFGAFRSAASSSRRIGLTMNQYISPTESVVTRDCCVRRAGV